MHHPECGIVVLLTLMMWGVSFEARDGMLCQNSKLKNCDKARQGMLCWGKYFSEGFPSNESRRQQNAQILGHLGPKLREGRKRRGMNVFPRRKVVGMSRSLQKAWILGHHHQQQGQAHPPAEQENPLRWRKNKRRRRKDAGAEEEDVKSAANFLASFSFSSSPSSPLLFRGEGAMLTFGPRGALSYPTQWTLKHLAGEGNSHSSIFNDIFCCHFLHFLYTCMCTYMLF